MKIEVMVLGMMWLIIPIVSLSAAEEEGLGGTCWKKVENCLEERAKQNKTNPEFDESSSSYNRSKLLCCSLIQETARSDKSCFCNLNAYVQRNPAAEGNVSRLLETCNLFNSLGTLHDYCFSDSSAAPGSSILPPPPGKKKKKNTALIATVAASATLLVLIIVGVGVGVGFYCRKVKKRAPIGGQPCFARPAIGDDIITQESLQYKFDVLKAATNNFSVDYKIGQGGFGVVYKGVLANGEEIAVKRLSKSSCQGDKEFQNEAAFVAKLQHRNLVRLMGFCLTNNEKLLVYEFMQNKSLDYFIFDPEKQKELNWSRRFNIINGIARGMLYLHEDSPTRIIHRDLKAANVLLDVDMNPKIADFGMARIFRVEQTHAEASRIVGTCGYMAPEYLVHGQFSVKSDVYSFGVLVLEIVSGKRISAVIYQPGGGENLVSYAWKCLRDRKPLEFMDPTMRDLYSEDEILKCIHLGLLCVEEDLEKRPTMDKIVLMFNSDLAATGLSMPQYPAFLFGGYTEISTSNNVSAPWSASEQSISETHAS